MTAVKYASSFNIFRVFSQFQHRLTSLKAAPHNNLINAQFSPHLAKRKSIDPKSTFAFMRSSTSSGQLSADNVNSEALRVTNDYDYTGHTVLQTLDHSSQIFEKSQVPEPDLSSCHLLSYVLDLPWSNGFSTLLSLLNDRKNKAQHELAQRKLNEMEAKQYNKLCQRRNRHEPLQYILGKWDFYHDDMVICCRHPILCPRPETEELVDIVIQEVRQKFWSKEGKKTVRILDVGCGTGAIGIALAKEFRKEKYKENADIDVEVVAIDIMQEAVDLSMENAYQLLSDNKGETSNSNDLQTFDICGYKAICIAASDFTNQNSSFSKEKDNIIQKPHQFNFDLVVSNPPYIPSHDMETLSPDVVQYESSYALHGGKDGMDVIRDIVGRLPEWTQTSDDKNKEYDAICWMEVDTSHPKLIEKWLESKEEILNQKRQPEKVEFVEGRKDLSGRDRFVKLSVGKNAS